MGASLIDDLAYIRQFAGLSDAELGEPFGVPPGTVRAWFEGGDIPPDTHPRIERVAQKVRDNASADGTAGASQWISSSLPS